MNELEIIHHRQMEGLSIFFDTVDFRTPHIHSEWELIWVLEHPLAVTCGQEQFLLRPGEMILFNPNELHEFHKTGENCTFLCLQLSPSLFPDMQPVRVDEHLPGKFLEPAEMERMRKDLQDMLLSYLRSDPYYPLYCAGQACMLMYRLLCALPCHPQTPEETSSIGKRNARLNRFIRFVEENYMHRIRLEDFARQEECSLSYLSRFIKSTLNQNFQEYVTSVRFHRACEIIAAGQKRMLDVCMESGFSDYRYFSREFRRQYGMTPEEYSCHTKRMELQTPAVRRSLQSVEWFYTKEESLKLAWQFFGVKK